MKPDNLNNSDNSGSGVSPDNQILKKRKQIGGGGTGHLYNVMSLCLLVFIFAAVVFLWGHGQYNEPGPLRTSQVIQIKQGMGTSSIVDLLYDKNVITDKNIFKAALVFKQTAGRLKAGQYEFAPAVSMAVVHDLIVKGRGVAYKVTIPEGFTSWQIVEKLNNIEGLNGDITKIPPEGSLHPNTYNFITDSSRQEILDQMALEQEKLLAQIWAGRAPDLPLKSPQELVILASIVEKETGLSGERHEVAGVFINRLRKGMKLQSDPTVIYGLTQGVGGLGRGLLRSELDKPTPFNTYTIMGMPPTPICNPGVSALQATANPAPTDNLFFVADGTGGHVFAKTYAEHKRNVANWRKIEKTLDN